MRHGISARDDDSTVVPLRRPGLSDVAFGQVDLNDLNSPHTLAVLSIPPGSSVLDVGCGAGIVARAVAARGCKVWGVEVDHRRAELARHSCVEVLEADLESISLAGAFPGLTFDVVLFLDVLEHLRDPQAVLAASAPLLAPGGSVLLSVPNVTHGALRLELLAGKFRYRSSGLLDRGHLRFFDSAGLDDLIRLAGFRVETCLRVTRALDQTEFDVNLASLSEELRQALETDPDALTYQFFVAAKPTRDSHALQHGMSLAERQRARIDELSAALEQGAAYAQHLQAALAARDATLREIDGVSAAAERARGEEFTAELERKSADIAHLEAQLAGREADIGEMKAALDRDRRLRDQLVATLERGSGYAAHLKVEMDATSARLRRVEAEFATVEQALELKTRRLLDVESAFAGLEREVEATAARLRDAEEAARQAARALEASDARSRDLEQALAEQRRVAEDADAYVRHLEAELRRRAADIAIRDDEISVLRAHIERAERFIADRDRAIAEREAEIAAFEGVRSQLEEAERIIAERDLLLQDAHAVVAEGRRLVAEQAELLRQPRHRVAEQGNAALKRWTPLLHRLLRRVVAPAGASSNTP